MGFHMSCGQAMSNNSNGTMGHRAFLADTDYN